MKITNMQIRTIFYLTGDILIFFGSVYFAYLLRFNGNIPMEHSAHIAYVAFLITSIKVAVFASTGLYKVSWKFFSINDIKKIAIGLTLSSFILYIYWLFIFYKFQIPFPRSVIAIDLFVSFVFISFFRGSKRIFLSLVSDYKKKEKKVAVVGLNQKAGDLIKSSRSDPKSTINIVCVFDNKMRGSIAGIPIYQTNQLSDICKKEGFDEIILSEIEDQKKTNEIVSLIKSSCNARIRKYIGLGDTVEDISIEDLLARRPVDLDIEPAKKMIKNRVVMVTGAGGSIGSELCRQAKKLGAKKILLVDSCEYNLYKISSEIEETGVEILADISKRNIIENSFKKEKPDIVIHAAAYKHVPICEDNPDSAIENNIIGTKNIIDLSIKEGVKRVILISTDKAVRPTNVMGATKRVCELYAQNVDSGKTIISSVRFGNVLGSSGSVIPKFKELLKKNKNLPVTHKDITRYFMLIPEACQLVLQAASIAKHQELFVLDMGEPVKIYDLAKKMIELSGKNNINIEIVGLRPGEKLYEELLIDEGDRQTKYKGIYIAKKTEYDIQKLKYDIQKLLTDKDKKSGLKKIVKEYKFQD